MADSDASDIKSSTSTGLFEEDANDLTVNSNASKTYHCSQHCETDVTNERNLNCGLSLRAMKRIKRFERIKLAKSKSKGRKIEDRGYSKAIFSETDYYFEDGLRKVYPYHFTFTTHAKERWFKKTLMEVFTKEFLAETPENYRKHIESGLILVNGKATSENYVLKNGDEVAHTIHRHENPVVGSRIEILYDSDDVLVINKPASIPCHPCGKYRHNSIVFILGKELGYSNLRNIYRLDRLTSGVLILGKTVARTKQLEDHILKRQVQKEYVCRVVGKFPDGVIKVDKPLACMRHNLTLWKVQSGGKDSQTTFERLSFNGDSSVVKCVPYTGRTHQIRVHLQYLGYPIVNDPFYNTEAWGPSRGKGGIIEKDEKEVAEAILKEHNVGQWIVGENSLYHRKLAELKQMKTVVTPVKPDDEDDGLLSSNKIDQALQDATEESRDEPQHKRIKFSENMEPRFEEKMWNIDVNCDECKLQYFNPKPKDLVLFLHAHKYKGPDWSYEAPLPYWAAEHWKDIDV